jgi:hypothetical protein
LIHGKRGRPNAASLASTQAGLLLPGGIARLSEPEDDPSPQLRQLSEEVGRIARTLAMLSANERQGRPDRREAATDRREGERREGDRRELPDRRAPSGDRQMPSISTIRAMIRARRLRDQYFSGELFADPAWDMLLDLLLARLERRTVAVSSLCIAAAVPPTTALRWIKRLTEEGIFIRTADPRDGRRVFIDLSDEAADAMASYIGAIERIGVTPP